MPKTEIALTVSHAMLRDIDAVRGAMSRAEACSWALKIGVARHLSAAMHEDVMRDFWARWKALMRADA